MKISVSLPDEDVALLDEHARREGLASRSAAVHHAVRLLRRVELEADYESAWREWESSPDAKAWEASSADGIMDAKG